MLGNAPSFFGLRPPGTIFAGTTAQRTAESLAEPRAIDREYITIREHVIKGNLLPVWIETARNCSDLGTKSGIATILSEGLNKTACGLAHLPLPAGHKILFGPVERPVLRGSHQTMDAVEHPLIAALRAETK